MYKQDVYLKNGTLFANGFNRVVHGERGDYVEFEKDHIQQNLISKFNNDLNEENDYYYWWLYPESDPEVKVYLQKRTVKYADYKVDKYYISPAFLKEFKDPEQLFIYD